MPPSTALDIPGMHDCHVRSEMRAWIMLGLQLGVLDASTPNNNEKNEAHVK